MSRGITRRTRTDANGMTPGAPRRRGGVRPLQSPPLPKRPPWRQEPVPPARRRVEPRVGRPSLLNSTAQENITRASYDLLIGLRDQRKVIVPETGHDIEIEAVGHLVDETRRVMTQVSSGVSTHFQIGRDSQIYRGLRAFAEGLVRPKPETAALLAAAVHRCGPDRIRTGDLVLDRDVC